MDDVCVFVRLWISEVKSAQSHICSMLRGQTTAFPMIPRTSCCSPPLSGRGGEERSHSWYTAGNTHTV